MQPVLALRSIVSPVVSGVERLPDPLTTSRPLLFVGNHTRFGLYDLPMLVSPSPWPCAPYCPTLLQPEAGLKAAVP